MDKARSGRGRAQLDITDIVWGPLPVDSTGASLKACSMGSFMFFYGRMSLISDQQRGGRALSRAGSIRHEEPDEILLGCGKVIVTLTVTVMSSRLRNFGMGLRLNACSSKIFVCSARDEFDGISYTEVDGPRPPCSRM